tara:strand:+ start:1300 stop:2142 length:843 start_codon:yes stop_codon:yes gene_type:complete
MKHIATFVIGAFALTACATTNSTSQAGAPALASQAFNYAPVREQPASASQFGYRLLGDEGDWAGVMAFQAEGSALVVDLDFDQGDAHTDAGLDVAMPYLSGGVRRFVGQSRSGDAVEVELQAGPCVDARSGATRTHFATVTIGGGQYRGCAQEEAASDRWTNYLSAYLPAIDTCLNELRRDAEHVTLAFPVSSATGVRLGNRLGQRWECVTRDNNRAVNAVRSLDADDVMAGENDPIFVRGQMPAAGEGCYVYESVRMANGELIGAYGFDACNAPTGPVG